MKDRTGKATPAEKPVRIFPSLPASWQWLMSSMPWSYKEPFSFEKAMEIIKEGEGTQFDPLIAAVFVESADEVREITAAHESMPGQGIRNFNT